MGFTIDHLMRGKHKKHKWIHGTIGTIDYGVVSEDDVYEILKLHSRWIDRINPHKMYMMTGYIRDALNIDEDDFRNLLTNRPWKFYGKNHVKGRIPLWDD